MKKTVLITGASTGIGKETALYFHENGWNVIATMRNPERRKTELHNKKDIDLIHLDVLDSTSIQNAINFAINKYGKIDVLVNNAGYALVGPFEVSSREQIEKQFQTNVFGLMDVMREVIPVFKKQKEGVIVNLASIGGRTAFPLYSSYNSTKWALEGFSESVHYELKPFNIKVKVIEPGLIKTDFYDRSADNVAKEAMGDYNSFAERALKNMNESAAQGSHPRVVAKTVFKAANDRSWKLRYSTGKNAAMILTMRKLLPDRVFFGLIKGSVLK
ncbi:MAG: SDR family oxidoreductase [Clostridia bacterium]|nr:SDR family oxidoreductase [Clostridia bacterium]